MNERKIVCILFVLVCLAGCATVGVKFDPQKTSSIKIGETTKEEIIQLFGRPFLRGEGMYEGIYEGKKVEIWHWEYAKATSSGMRGEVLTIYFSENKVLGYEWGSNFPKSIHDIERD